MFLIVARKKIEVTVILIEGVRNSWFSIFHVDCIVMQWCQKNILCYVDVLIVEKFVWWNPDLKITGWCSEDGQKLFCAAQEPSGTRDGRQLRWWLGGRTVERRATIWTTLQCQLVFLNPISPGGEGRQICPHPAQTRIPVKINGWKFW